MSMAMTDDLASMLAAKLSASIEEFDLKVVRIDATEALLIGANYALQFSADRDGIESLMYIERGRRGQLSAYTLRPLIAQRFTQEDSARYGNPETIKERLLASLSVYASGLESRCRDVLGGEKSWLKRDSWGAGSLGAATQEILQSELPVSANR